MLRTILVLTALCALALPSQAFAGRLIATGHDADLHCTLGDQCGFVKVAVDYVRGGAPDPGKPVLILDRGENQMSTALDNAYGPGIVPRVIVDPRSDEFKQLRLSTEDYSAILVASDYTCGGCDLNAPDEFSTSATPDSDAINARSEAIAAFFNEGGGIFAGAGSDHGDGDPDTGPDTYYSFIPLPLGGRQVRPPFRLTDAGRSLGFEDAQNGEGTRDDINCCATHNSFQEPSPGSALGVAETEDPSVWTDAAPETIFTDSKIEGGRFVNLPPPEAGETVNVVPEGVVRVKFPRGRSAGRAHAAQSKFVRLREARQIPVGSILDTKRGSVQMTSAADLVGSTQTGDFSKGRFKIRQRRSARPVTDLVLNGGSFRRCRRSLRRASTAARRIRRLRGSGRGRFRTRGRYGSATVRGTVWTMSDQCNGTLTRVSEGTVLVRDFAKRRNVLLSAPRSYLARPKRR